jgi:hypothetical protein
VTEIGMIIARRQIAEIVHFTSNNGLVGCLQLGALVSRRQLPAEKHLSYVVAPTAAVRAEESEFFDKDRDWLDYVNLSISEINARYFRFASGWHQGSDRWWVVLSFDSAILGHDGVYFTTTNNIYPLVRRGEGAAGLDALFGNSIRRKAGWIASRNLRAENLPTCEQAEVLYPYRLSLDYLRKVYVRTDEQHDIVSGWLNLYRRGDVEVVIGDEKFFGVPN